MSTASYPITEAYMPEDPAERMAWLERLCPTLNTMLPEVRAQYLWLFGLTEFSVGGDA